MDEHTRTDEHTKVDEPPEIDESSEEGESSEEDESPEIDESPKMDDQTRVKYEEWKRNRIKRRIISPVTKVLCIFVLLVFAIAVYNSRENIEESYVANTNTEYEPPLADPEFRPIVYLFNAHPLEKIGSSYDDIFVGDMSIVELTHILAGHLESHGISTLVEERCVDAKLHENDWEFHMSYYAARYFLLDVVDRYSSLEFFIDLHRDGVLHEHATIEVDGVTYAQILFVIGIDNPVGYDGNYAVARELHDMLEERMPGISRGIFFSGDSPDRDGVYSQDVSPTVQLIEIGTVTSTTYEVSLTVEILAEVLAEYVLLNDDSVGD